jgi:transcriptional regulator with XRE-family HTH domain
MTGSTLRYLRKTLGLTQQELADKLLLCGRGFICDMECGRKPISKQTQRDVVALFMTDTPSP